MIMRKKFFIKKEGWTAINNASGGKFEELNLYVIHSESLCTIFDSIPNLSFAERYALYKSYFKKETSTQNADGTLASNTSFSKSYI